MSIGFFLGVCTLIPAVVIFVIGALNTKRMTVECPVCDRHRNYWGWRGFWVYAPLFALTVITVSMAVLAVTGRLPAPGFTLMFAGDAMLVIVWAIVASFIQRRSLKAIEITDDDITLEPVHAAFLEQLRLGRAQSRSAFGTETGWEDYDPYPRRMQL